MEKLQAVSTRVEVGIRKGHLALHVNKFQDESDESSDAEYKRQQKELLGLCTVRLIHRLMRQ